MTAPRPILVSEREYEVLQLIHAGLSNKQINAALGINCANGYASTAYRKLGITSGTCRVMAALAFERGQVAMVRASVVDIASPVQPNASGDHLSLPSEVEPRLTYSRARA